MPSGRNVEGYVTRQNRRKGFLGLTWTYIHMTWILSKVLHASVLISLPLTCGQGQRKMKVCALCVWGHMGRGEGRTSSRPQKAWNFFQNLAFYLKMISMSHSSPIKERTKPWLILCPVSFLICHTASFMDHCDALKKYPSLSLWTLNPIGTSNYEMDVSIQVRESSTVGGDTLRRD